MNVTQVGAGFLSTIFFVTKFEVEW